MTAGTSVCLRRNITMQNLFRYVTLLLHYKLLTITQTLHMYEK